MIEWTTPDVRGFFLDSHGNIFIGLKGCQFGSFGKTLKSDDNGSSFREVFNSCFWGFDEHNGSLFLGTYHENGEDNLQCSVLRSDDDGETWEDISDPSWKKQTHIHGLAVNDKGWIYATLGDVNGLCGCWRYKDNKWINKFGNSEDQYIGIVFKDGYVYLSDDNGKGRNPRRCAVYRAIDDGSDGLIIPEPVLTLSPDCGWGCFFLKMDSNGMMWTAVRPVGGIGKLFKSDDGINWWEVLSVPEEPLHVWRKTHTLRDRWKCE